MDITTYYSKKTRLFLIETEDGVVLTPATDWGQPMEAALVYGEPLEDVMHEYAKLGLDDWEKVANTQISDSIND